jgi:hypothetical protein
MTIEPAAPAPATAWTPSYPADKAYEAHCALVLHGNQGLGYTDVLHGRSDNLEGSGFDEALQVHQGTGVPGNFHLSGTLMTAAEWAARNGDPVDFNAWLAAGTSAGWAGMVTSAYGQHIMPFVNNEMNDWAVSIQAQMVQARYGYTPRVAWVPERVWLNTSGYPSSGVNDWIGDNWQAHGIWGVILDDDVHLAGHDNHRIHTLSGNGLRLVPRDRSFTGNIIGGNGQGSLDILTGLAAGGVGQYRIAVLAEDWEAIGEMGGWASITPNAKETYDWFVGKCATESAWLHTWKLADAISNPDFTGDTMTVHSGHLHRDRRGRGLRRRRQRLVQPLGRLGADRQRRQLERGLRGRGRQLQELRHALERGLRRPDERSRQQCLAGRLVRADDQPARDRLARLHGRADQRVAAQVLGPHQERDGLRRGRPLGQRRVRHGDQRLPQSTSTTTASRRRCCTTTASSPSSRAPAGA